MVLIPIADAKEKKEFSLRVKIMNNIRCISEEILKCTIGDESGIAEIMAGGDEKEKMRFKKGDVVEIKNVVVSEKSPLFVFTKKTDVKVINASIPDEKIYSTRFIDKIPEYGYTYIEGFVSRIFSIYDYYCKRCKKFTEKVCSCGNIAEKIFKIAGIFSDSTGDILFVTNDENVAEKIANIKKEGLKKIENTEKEREIVKGIMNRNHKFFGYISEKKFIIVDDEILLR